MQGLLTLLTFLSPFITTQNKIVICIDSICGIRRQYPVGF